MKKLLSVVSLVSTVTLLGCSAPTMHSQTQQQASDITAATTITNVGTSICDWMISKYPNIETLTSKKKWEYTNGMILHGFILMYDKTKNVKYINYVKTWADKYISTAGVINRASTYSLDLIQPSDLLFALYTYTGDARYKTAATSQRNLYPSFLKNAEGGFYHKDTYANQMWLDGLYMGEPFIVEYGSKWETTTTGKDFCYNTATFQLKKIWEHTNNSSKKLVYHAWDYSKSAAWANATTGVSPEFWGRSVGWYMMALVDVLDYLPTTHPDYAIIKGYYVTLAAGLKTYQDASTGLWWQVIDKGGQSGNYLETSASGMFVYALKKGINKGYIDSATYLPVCTKGWAGIKTKLTIGTGTIPASVTIAGAVGGMSVQTSYANYVAIKASNNAPHGFAGVLAAASVME